MSLALYAGPTAPILRPMPCIKPLPPNMLTSSSTCELATFPSPDCTARRQTNKVREKLTTCHASPTAKDTRLEPQVPML